MLRGWCTYAGLAQVMPRASGGARVPRAECGGVCRLENEHLNNVGKFRAVRTIPLPFKDLEGAEV